ncbi:universal stress protein [Alisedimentitalea sp. MJ-SS2]|uniref:universal stress protein n=1 Tax=Aliisedimentitalea sp. MJ-SS2 TaxID=3049795 RepID=UPI00290BCB3A|nr:universal stress protein [Alisedimentitalea sp. MJ-SS2]MDU8925879.1 universal stress protein [Alisedimentitalea sp. MJ-SS2]
MYMNILVPVSFDEERDPGRSIAVARALAGEGAHITLLHVIEQVPAYAAASGWQSYLEDARKAVQAELDKMAEAIPNAEGVVIEGHSGRSILDYAKEKWSDCIIIASHRPGLQDYFLGSTASHVVRHAGCAVHVIR